MRVSNASAIPSVCLCDEMEQPAAPMPEATLRRSKKKKKNESKECVMGMRQFGGVKGYQPLGKAFIPIQLRYDRRATTRTLSHCIVPHWTLVLHDKAMQ